MSTVNRTMIRGVTAGLMGVGLVIGAVVVGPTIASGAETASTWQAPVPVARQKAVLDWDLPNVRYLRHVHKQRPHRNVAERASRTSYRQPLTGDPRTIAHAMVLNRGWSEGEFSCLDALWTRESGWNVYATNPSSGAYGIPQALPGYKMAEAGADWRTNPVTQITWGLSYIAASYGSPCSALSHSNATGYY
jgi:hypothetical protein